MALRLDVHVAALRHVCTWLSAESGKEKGAAVVGRRSPLCLPRLGDLRRRRSAGERERPQQPEEELLRGLSSTRPSRLLASTLLFSPPACLPAKAGPLRSAGPPKCVLTSRTPRRLRRSSQLPPPRLVELLTRSLLARAISKNI